MSKGACGCCEHGNEHSGSIKSDVIIDLIGDYQLLYEVGRLYIVQCIVFFYITNIVVQDKLFGVNDT
jgi:hypothetical protein